MNKIFTLFAFLCTMSFGYSQIDISEARNMSLGSTVTIEGIATNGEELGIIRYVQDDSGGIAVYPGAGSVGDFPDEVKRGDLVQITGELKEFNGLLEVDPITDYSILSSGNDLPEPASLTTNEIEEETEAILCRVENVTFTAGGNTFSVGNYEITTDDGKSEIYVRSNHPMIGEEIPLAKVNLTGIVSQFNSIYQVLPRGIEDLEIADDFFLTMSPKQSNIETNSFKIEWETNEQATSVIKYGTTPALGEVVEFSDLKTSHEIDLNDLEPATFYYLQVCSNNGSTEVSSSIGIYSTASNSSGTMKVYFTHQVDGSFSSGPFPFGTTGAAIEGEIIKRINEAQTSIDASIYNINRTTIVSALNDAYDRGVVVRYIADNETANLALSNPTPDFPIIRGNPDGLMHNKFFIFDAEDTDNSWILTGSTNMTEQNIASDYNNAIFIQDEALAKAYTMEFEEMWGTDQPDPGIFTVLFGSEKSNNTPHLFSINGIDVESYFSPSDNTTIAIAKAIASADSELQFALLTFTNNELGDAVLKAHNSGIVTRGIVDNINDQGSEFDYLLSNGVNISTDNTTTSTHHKYCIIDANELTSDPQVVLGSHNWSGAAETRNDENTLIIHDDRIANLYLQEFEARWCESQAGVDCVTSTKETDLFQHEFEIYPNPTTDYANVELTIDETNDITLQLLDSNGRTLQSVIGRNIDGKYQTAFDLIGLPSANYFIKATVGQETSVLMFSLTK